MLEDVPLAKITLGTRFRRDLGDIQSLAMSIQHQGLFHPVVVSTEHVLIVGQRRLEACRALGWETIPARILDLDDPLSAEHDENVQRKNFTPTEAVAIGEAIEARAKVRLQVKQQEAAKRGGRGNKKPSGKLPEGLGEESREIAATAVGMKTRTYAKATAVVHAAQQDEDYANLPDEMDRTGNVDAAYRQLPDALRLANPAQAHSVRKRRPLSLSKMTLRLDRYIEGIVRDIRWLTDDEFLHLCNMFRHYLQLLEAERKDHPDDSHD